MTVEPTPGQEIRDWQLERYALGELPADEARALRDVLVRDEEARARLRHLEESNAEVLRQHPPTVVAAAIQAADPGRLTAGSRTRPRFWPALAAAAAAIVMGAGAVVLAPRTSRESEPPDVTRVKGVTPYLLVYRKASADEIERLQPGTLARDHDQVQLAYQAAGRRYGVIVSVDGRGVVTRHLPVAGATAVGLKTGPPVPLPQSYELDDAPGFERFYLVTADEPFAVDRVLTAVRRRHDATAATETPGHRLELPPSLDQFSFALEKETVR